MAHWTVTDNIISVDFKKVPTEAELKEQAKAILAMSCDQSMIGKEFGADTSPCEMVPYMSPDKDPA